MPSYCKYSRSEKSHPLHAKHHEEYGFPIEDDNKLFQRLCLEINQAGLSWETILKKEDTLNKAYDGFDIDKIAGYCEEDIKRLMNDSGVIRHELKIKAIIHNANVIQDLQKKHGAFKAWLDKQELKTREEWTKLFRNTFKFTGGEIVNEFLVSTGYLPGAHDEDCELYEKVLKANPAWKKN